MSTTTSTDPADETTLVTLSPAHDEQMSANHAHTPVTLPPQRYKGYVYVPVEELQVVSNNETPTANINPENGKPQWQRRPPKKSLEFIYDDYTC